MQHHGYSLTELDNMIPWEREIYVALLQQFIKEENERNEKMNELAEGWKYGMERIVRKIVKDAIESGLVKAEEFV